MTDMQCRYTGDRDETLIAYLYDDIDPAARAVFDAHLAACTLCRSELDAMRGVRTQLSHWVPPEPGFAVAAPRPPVLSRPSKASPSWWREIPAWAQVAAALLFLGVSAGLANLDIRYDASGLTVRTGWSKPAAPAPQDVNLARSDAAPDASRASKADLAALAQQLHADLRAVQTSAASSTAAAPRAASNDADVLRKVRALIDEAERRQESELALRLAQAMREMGAQRQADLRRIDLSLNGVQNTLGVEVLKQRQSLNHLILANQRQ